MSQKGNAIAVCYAQKSVSYIISLVEKNSSIETHRTGYYGQKQSTNTKDEFFSNWQSKFNAMKTIGMLQNDLAQVSVGLSLHFMRGGRINAVKYARRLIKKKVLTIFMMRKRVKLARKYKKWPEEDWKEFL